MPEDKIEKDKKLFRQKVISILSLVISLPTFFIGIFFSLKAFQNHGYITELQNSVIFTIAILLYLSLLVVYVTKK